MFTRLCCLLASRRGGFQGTWIDRALRNSASFHIRVPV